MDSGANSSFSEEITAALDWWRGAGVDYDFADAPADWITPPVVTEASPPEDAPAKPAIIKPARNEAPPPPLIAADNLPDDIASFTQWWLSEASLDNGQLQGRIAPRGVAGAAVMVLVPHPEREDSTELLSGPQGRLLAQMANAMGLTPDQLYIASALPRHTPHADWEALNLQGMGDILAHHIKLVAPKRLICFGNTILPLMDHHLTNKADNLRIFNHEGGNVPLLVDRDLGALVERPRWKAGFWQRWLDWSREGTA